MEEEEAEASAELISPRISFSHDLAAFASAAETTQPEPRWDASLMSRRRRRRQAPEPEFDFANAAAADVAPADRLFADGKLLPVPPLPPTAPHARCGKPVPAWHQKGTRPAPRPWASRFARSSSVNSAAASSGRFTCPAFPLMRSRSTGSAAATVGAHRSNSKKVAPTTTTTTAPASNGNAAPRSVYYYGYGSGRSVGDGHGGGVRVSPVLNVTSIGTSVVNMLSYLLCDCGENKATKQHQSRGFGVRCWVTR